MLSHTMGEEKNTQQAVLGTSPQNHNTRGTDRQTDRLGEGVGEEKGDHDHESENVDGLLVMMTYVVFS